MSRLLWSLSLVTLFACGGSAPAPTAEKPAAEKPAAEKPVASKPAAPADGSAAFKVVVQPDTAARDELLRLGERIIVDVTVTDPNAGGDDQGYRTVQVELPAEGGTAEIAPIDLSPAKPGGGRLTDMSITVVSARKSAENNLLNCPYAGDSVEAIKPSYTVGCSLL